MTTQVRGHTKNHTKNDFVKLSFCTCEKEEENNTSKEGVEPPDREQNAHSYVHPIARNKRKE